MQSAGSVKIGAAFLAGIVVALGGALLYMKASEPRLQPAMQVSTADDGGSTPDEAVPRPTPQVTAHAPDQQPQKQPVIGKVTLAIKSTAKPRVTSRPVSLAVWHPKREPPQAPVTQVFPAPAASTPGAHTEPPPVPEAAPEPQPAAPRLDPQPAARRPQPHVVTIPAGTTLTVRVNEKLSTDHNYSGDTFLATLDSPVVMEGFIIADRGAKVLGRVVKAQKPGRMQGLAELSLALTEVATTDGQRVQLETNESLRKGPSSTGDDVVKMAGGAALGAIIGAIAGGGKGAAIGAGAGGAAGTGAVLLGRGKPAVIESETLLTFELANPTTVTEHLN